MSARNPYFAVVVRPQAQSGFDSNGANSIDGDASTSASETLVTTAASGYFTFSNWSGADIPSDVKITGVQFSIKASYIAMFAATKLIDFEVSLTGTGGTFISVTDTSVTSHNLLTTARYYVVGHDKELWNHNWRGFTDLSDLAFRFKCDQQNDALSTSVTGVFDVYAQIYYRKPSIRMKSGTLKLRGGGLKCIKTS